MSYSESDPVVVILALQGVWLHDPADPEETARNFSYGSAKRRAQRDGASELTHFAGREFPVADIGPYKTEAVSVSVDVPHGPDWSTRINEVRALPDLLRPITYRDNRGRNFCGLLSGLTEQDERWGSSVSFTMTRVEA
jgi:hypothetical protein